MKTNRPSFFAIVNLLLLFFVNINFAQPASNETPYLTVTTMYWNMDREDFDMETWKAVEKEYLTKVTMKNEHISSASFYLHLFGPDNSEVLYVQTYPSWEAMGKAAARSAELEALAWPNEKAREAFLKNQESYFTHKHSDEIYAPQDGIIARPENIAKDLVLYVRKTYFAFPEDGSLKEFNEMRAENLVKVTQKNEYIKGYYPNTHAWGSDRTEFVEAFYVESMCDLEKMFDRNSELINQAWPDGPAADERGKKWGKYFTGLHGDWAYTLIAGLTK